MDGSVCAAKHEEQNYAAGVMSLNGKSIGEVRDFEELNVQEFTNVANAFSMKLNYKKMWN
ncbi:MAG: hypothetical protein LC115_07095 [Bacteroidia bacterium]|nr:hypothetical protein [Bacteroidia bacterium]